MEKKDNLLVKWLSGDMSEQERRQFESENDLSGLKYGLDLLDNLKYPDFDQKKALDKIIQKRKSKEIVFSMSFLLKVASIILVVGGLAYYFMGNQNFSVSTDFAETKTIFLPDHSEIIINHNSTISYDKKNWDKQRLVFLKGEAFFKVAKGSIFVVKSKNGLVQVLGTQFNVFDRKNVLRVACYEGKVQVINEETNYQRAITPSESVYLVDHKQIYSIFEEMKDIPSWISGKMTVKAKSVTELLGYLSAESKLEFDLSQIDTSKKYSGPIDLTDIEKSVALMAKAMGWAVEKTSNGKKIILKEK